MRNNDITYVMFLVEGVGHTTFIESNESKKYKILDFISDTKYRIIERKRTKEELEELGRIWEQEGHLMSKEGYINRIKDELITEPNKDYPNNIIELIGNDYQKYDIIFVRYSSLVIDKLKVFSENTDLIPVFIYPGKASFYDYIGRLYVSGKEDFLIKTKIRNWDKLQENYTNTHLANSLHFPLQVGDYLSTIVSEISYIGEYTNGKFK